DADSVLVPRTVNDQFTKSDLPDFPSSPTVETPPAATTNRTSIPDWTTQVPDVAKTSPAPDSIVPVDRYTAAEQPAAEYPAVQRLPESPVTPVIESTIAPQVQAPLPSQVNDASPRINSVIATPTAAKLVVRTPPRTPEMNG